MTYAAARRPFGRFNGAFAAMRPDDLAATAIEAVLAKAPMLEPVAIDEVGWGNANGAGGIATSAGWPHCWPVCRSRFPAPPSTACAAQGWMPR